MMAGIAMGQALAQVLVGQGAFTKNKAIKAAPVPMRAVAPAARIATPAAKAVRVRAEAKAEPFTLVSKLPGRRRYRVAGLGEELAKALEALSSLAFLTEVKANAVTGSILFTFEPSEKNEEAMDSLAAFLRERVFKFTASKEEKSAQEARAGYITKSLRGSVRDFSAFLQRHTGGWLDISSAAALFFLLRGFRKMLINNEVPSGSQMLWWAMSLLRGWRTV